MKTEREQIEKMARTMCGYCSTDGKCAVSQNLREPDICANVDTQYCLYKEHAEQLIENGYGDVTEYKAEIERLKKVIKNYKEVLCETTQRKDDAIKLNDQLVDEYENKIKQAKIDIVKKIEKAQLCGVSMYYVIKDLKKEIGDEN